MAVHKISKVSVVKRLANVMKKLLNELSAKRTYLVAFLGHTDTN